MNVDTMDEALLMVLDYCSEPDVKPDDFIRLYWAYKTDLATFNNVLSELEEIYNPRATSEEIDELVNSWKR